MSKTEELLGQIFWIPCEGAWMCFRTHMDVMFIKKGEDWKELSSSDKDSVLELQRRFNDNRLGFFLPHGGGKDFLNDWENGICMLVAPTRSGKSCHGTAFSLFRTIKCDPDWQCFQDHTGIDYHEWRGPRKLVVSSYSWGNVKEVWDEYRKWCPRSTLGVYADDWGTRPGENGAHKPLSFESGKSQRCKLTDGCEIVFLCDGQGQAAWEGKRWDDSHFDEQRMREKWIGYLRGTANTLGLVQAAHTLTGHVLEGRPDTGAGGWIYNDLWLGNYTYGKTVGRYKIDMDDVPEAVLSPERKAELLDQWVTQPAKNQDEEMIRKGEARYWGGWESGAGLVLSNFYPEHHMIPEYDRKHSVVKDTSRYRGMDHGLGRPATCIWLEVFPWGDIVAYREYYMKGRTIPYHAREIVKASGNTSESSGVYEDADIISPLDTYQEVFGREEYQASVMDGRSFASPAQDRACTIGQLYNDYGLYCTPASTQQNVKLVPLMKSYLQLDPERPHIMWQFRKKKVISEETYQSWLKGRSGDYKNGSKLYFVDTLRATFSEMRKWAMNSKTNKPVSKDDHIVGGALKYALAESPVYYGKRWRDETPGPVEEDDKRVKGRDYKYVVY